MSFDVTAGAYRAFMGRFSEPLADGVMGLLPADVPGPVLDVGCGPGALTGRLVDRWGARQVAAIDPSASFVEEVRQQFPGVDARRCAVEQMPWRDESFTVTTASLVVHFLTDPVGGVREMQRVTTPGGTVALTVWDQGGGRGPVAPFWRALRELHPDAPDESTWPGTGAGQLAALAAAAGLTVVLDTELTVSVPWSSFEAWWFTYTLGVGPAGAYLAGLPEHERDEVRSRAADLLPDGAFSIDATAWCVLSSA